MPKKAKRLGRCYELAGRLILNDEAESSTLVHGEVNCLEAPSGRTGHAWISFGDDTIYDPVLDQHMPQKRFSQKYCAIAEQSYTKEQAAQFMIKTGHWGPWL